MRVAVACWVGVGVDWRVGVRVGVRVAVGFRVGVRVGVLVAWIAAGPKGPSPPDCPLTTTNAEPTENSNNTTRPALKSKRRTLRDGFDDSEKKDMMRFSILELISPHVQRGGV